MRKGTKILHFFSSTNKVEVFNKTEHFQVLKVTSEVQVSQKRYLNVNKRFLLWNTNRPRRAGQPKLPPSPSCKTLQNSATAASKQLRMSTSNLLLMSSCLQVTTGVWFWVPILMWALRSNQLNLLLSQVTGINTDVTQGCLGALGAWALLEWSLLELFFP